LHILHICSHKWSLPGPAIFRPAIYGALKSRSDSQSESDQTIYAIENIGLIILKRPLKSASVTSVAYTKADEMAWISALDSQPFIGRVDLKQRFFSPPWYTSTT
jgi:hypothetical protein